MSELTTKIKSVLAPESDTTPEGDSNRKGIDSMDTEKTQEELNKEVTSDESANKVAEKVAEVPATVAEKAPETATEKATETVTEVPAGESDLAAVVAKNSESIAQILELIKAQAEKTPAPTAPTSEDELSLRKQELDAAKAAFEDITAKHREAQERYETLMRKELPAPSETRPDVELSEHGVADLPQEKYAAADDGTFMTRSQESFLR